MDDRASGFGGDRALSIKELPRGERPRERLKDHGASSLSAAELLGLVIGSGSGGASAVQLGHEVLSAAGGSLRRMASQPVAALTAMRGVGPARAVAIHAALELGRRLATEVREEGAPMR
jgi:DNA repair protein RadC